MAQIEGTDEADIIVGTDNADFILAGSGDDTVFGGGGNDTLFGDAGADELTGGAGADNFFSELNELEGDIITDFEPGLGGDRIGVQFASPEVFEFELVDIGDDLSVTITNNADVETVTLLLLGLANRDFSTVFVSNPGLLSGDLFLVEDGGGGNEGFDFIGTDEGEQIFGSEFDDTIDARGGDDLILGGLGQDIITTGPGRDNIFGQLGTFQGDIVTDFTPGEDFITLSLAQQVNVSVDLQSVGNDLILTYTDAGFTESITLQGLAAGGRQFTSQLGPGTPDGTSISIIEIFNPVVALGDAFADIENDTPLTGVNVLDNDQGGQGPRTVSAVNGLVSNVGVPFDLFAEGDVNAGTVTIQQNGALTFTPVEDFSGNVALGYTVTDGLSEDSALVTFTVIDVSEPEDPGEPPTDPTATLGTSGDDDFELQDVTDGQTIDLLGGNDRSITGFGDDTVLGRAGDDLIDDIDDMEDPTGTNTLLGGAGNDTIIGRAGSYVINGDDGADDITVYAAIETNVVRGGAGDDTIHFRRGTDNFIDGGEGNDDILVRKTLSDEVGILNDVRGGAGNDRVEVRDGIFNTITGGAGDDTLIGGSGNDTFVFEEGSGDDRVENFADRGGDRLDLTDFGVTTAAQFAAGAQQVGSDVVWTSGSGEEITFVDTNLQILTGSDLFFVTG